MSIGIRKLLFFCMFIFFMVVLPSTALATQAYTCDFKAAKTAGWAPFDFTIRATTNIPSKDIALWVWEVYPENSHSARAMIFNTPYVLRYTSAPNLGRTYLVALNIVTKSGSTVTCGKNSFITIYCNSFDTIPQSNPRTVTFTYTGTGNPTSFEWNFGDKSSSKQKNTVTHTYKNAGIYSVSLKVKNSVGTSTVSQSVIVT
jgi:PKD repeat protein